MNRHHQRFVLRQYIEHKNPANRRLHVWTNGLAWLGLTTVLSQVPLPLPFPRARPRREPWDRLRRPLAPLLAPGGDALVTAGVGGR